MIYQHLQLLTTLPHPTALATGLSIHRQPKLRSGVWCDPHHEAPWPAAHWPVPCSVDSHRVQ